MVVADDHPPVRDGVCHLETDKPNITAVAGSGSGDELIGVLNTQAADVVVLDINMPDHDGMGVLQGLRAMQPDPPLLSMFPEEAVCSSGNMLSSGTGYVSKRHAADWLAAAIRCVARGERYLSRVIAERLADVLVNPKLEAPCERLQEREFPAMRLLGGGERSRMIVALRPLNCKTVSTYQVRMAGQACLA